MTDRLEIIDGWGEQFAVWLWDEESSTEAVAFYDLDIDTRGALEVRMWSPQWPTTTAERKEIAESFNMYPKRAFSDANRRAVRIGELHREALKHFGKQAGARIKYFDVPSEEDIATLIAAKDNVMFRNRRDLQAHVQELRALQQYLYAVVFLGSESPMTRVSEFIGVDVTKSRSIIERARAHGYLTRNAGGVGGEITDYAEATAQAIRFAAAAYRKDKR